MERQDPEKEFNLLDEPWIIVKTKSNETKTWSILETFAHAHEAQSLAGELPTQDIAIMRLLLAIMHGAFVHENVQGIDSAIKLWHELWNLKEFPYDIIETYLEPYRDRFWLFHPTEPFYQSAHIKENMDAYKAAKGKKVNDEIKWKTVARLVGDLFQSDNAPRLFPDRTGKEQRSIGYAEAARWLLHLNGFDDDSAKMPTPQGVGYLGQLGLIYAKGNNLFETLMLNFVLADQRDEIFADSVEENGAYWEKTVCEIIEREIPQPRAQKDLLTMQSRRIFLHREHGQVTGYLLTMGDYFAKDASLLNETMTTWKNDDKKGIVPKKHQLDCQIWRDFSSLIGVSEESTGRQTCQPGVIHWLQLLRKENQDIARIKIVVTGAYYSLKGAGWQIVDYIHDDLMINAALLDKMNDNWIQEIARMLGKIKQAVSEFGTFALHVAEAAGYDEKTGHNDISKFARENAYHHLDSVFRKWLISIQPDKDKVSDKMDEWLQLSKKILLSLGNELLEQCPDAAITGRKTKSDDIVVFKAYQKFQFQIYHILG
ncbi:type I-E CRISPR-associated protein Cse1/CasA [uncultured Mitsuokella sp.]|uniref:type I-E CRISPR-associated protein Cse1/CasA n=1 Tax=uncultured Mitsuokella sp. TaxID=453120 RepID=UPI0025EB72FC|nr:type I-E CRISPR-associated protein Cse1/CasA [uncultured Mitsuokella sp.]